MVGPGAEAPPGRTSTGRVGFPPGRKSELVAHLRFADKRSACRRLCRACGTTAGHKLLFLKEFRKAFVGRDSSSPDLKT